MPQPIRIATFNTQNLFERPRVFNNRDKTVGDRALRRIDAFKKILDKDTYSAADKRQLVKQFTENGPNNLPPLNHYIMVREDQGKLWRKRNYKVIGVQAQGRGSWNGAIEFKKSKVSQLGRENTAKVIRAVKADVACIVEADNRIMLRQFDAELLRSRYPYEMLIDGNDLRGIDVGLYSKFKIAGMWTHMFDKLGTKKIFSRDCPEYEVILPDGRPLYILCNHLKSKGYDSAGTADQRRRNQAQAVADILSGYNLKEDLVVVAGDLNDTPRSDPLQPLMRKRYLYDVLKLQFPNDESARWTYHFNTFEQIDYLLVSRPLRDAFLEAGVERGGMYGLNRLTSASDLVSTETEYPTVTHWTNEASDHGAVWASFDL